MKINLLLNLLFMILGLILNSSLAGVNSNYEKLDTDKSSVSSIEIDSLYLEEDENENIDIKKAITLRNIKLAQNIIKRSSCISFKDKEILLNKKSNILHLASYFNVDSIFNDYTKDCVNKKSIYNIRSFDLAILKNNYHVIQNFLVRALEKNDTNNILYILKAMEQLEPDSEFELSPKLILFLNQKEEVQIYFLQIINKLYPSYINIQDDKHGSTPLMYALHNESGKVTEPVMLEMLKHKPDMNIQNKYGCTPLMYALSNKSGKVAEPVMLEMLKHNPDMNIQNKYGCTPLMDALSNKSGKVTEPVMLEMLKHNPDMNIQNKYGCTPLMYALSNKSGKVTEPVMLEMLKHKPDINIQDENGCTPLMFALRNESGKVTDQVVLKLLEFNITYKKEFLDLAQKYQSKNIVEAIKLKFKV